MVLSFPFSQGKLLMRSGGVFCFFFKYWVSLPTICFNVFLLIAQVSYRAASALCYFQHCRQRSQYKAIWVLMILWISPKSYQLQTPWITSEGNETALKKGKYILKMHSPPISMGNHISHHLLQLLRMAILIWMSSHKQCWGPKQSKSFPFTEQQTVRKVLHDFWSLRTLLRQGHSLKC